VGNHAEILRMWQLLGPYLNRRQRSLWDVAEAEAIGCGGGVLLAGITGLSVQAITTRRPVGDPHRQSESKAAANPR
jgi:hypothetical protein